VADGYDGAGWMSRRFSMQLTAGPGHIDVMGHVNNAVWVQWMEQVATAHWERDAAPAHVAAYAWVVVRHEIDYRGNIAEGETVEASTFIAGPPSGARFNRDIEFRTRAGKLIVQAKTSWAMIAIATRRLMRVPPEVAAPFLAD
jgi:acyl-CoA thioester hydrolase